MRLTDRSRTIHWLIELLILSASVFVATHILSSIHVRNFATAVVVALVYGILKTVFTRIFVVLALPLVILTLGLFYFVINAFLLWITAMLIEGFEVKGIFNTTIAALLISFIDTVLHWAIPWKRSNRLLQLLC